MWSPVGVELLYLWLKLGADGEERSLVRLHPTIATSYTGKNNVRISTRTKSARRMYCCRSFGMRAIVAVIINKNVPKKRTLSTPRDKLIHVRSVCLPPAAKRSGRFDLSGVIRVPV